MSVTAPQIDLSAGLVPKPAPVATSTPQAKPAAKPPAAAPTGGRGGHPETSQPQGGRGGIDLSAGLVPKTEQHQPPKDEGPSAANRFVTSAVGLPEGSTLSDATKLSPEEMQHPVKSIVKRTVNGLDPYAGEEEAAQVGLDQMHKPGWINKAVGAIRYTAAGIPYFGPSLVRSGTQVENKDWAGAAGSLVQPAVAIATESPELRGAVKSAPGKIADTFNATRQSVAEGAVSPLTKSTLSAEEAAQRYGQNSERAVTKEGVTGWTRPGIAENANAKLNEIGQAIGDTLKQPDNVHKIADITPVVDAAYEKAKIQARRVGPGAESALEEAYKRTKTEFGPLKNNLPGLHETQGQIRKLTSYTGNVSEDEIVNNFRKEVSREIQSEIKRQIPGISDLMQRYSDMSDAAHDLDRQALLAKGKWLAPSLEDPLRSVRGATTGPLSHLGKWLATPYEKPAPAPLSPESPRGNPTPFGPPDAQAIPERPPAPTTRSGLGSVTSEETRPARGADLADVPLANRGGVIVRQPYVSLADRKLALPPTPTRGELGTGSIEVGPSTTGHPIEPINSAKPGTPGSEPAAQKVSVNERMDPRPIIESAGAKFLGIQEGAKPDDAVAMFNSPKTNTTLAIKLSELTPEAVKAKLAESETRFAQANDKGSNTPLREIPQRPRSTTDAEVDESTRKNTEMNIQRLVDEGNSREDAERMWRAREIPGNSAGQLYNPASEKPEKPQVDWQPTSTSKSDSMATYRSLPDHLRSVVDDQAEAITHMPQMLRESRMKEIQAFGGASAPFKEKLAIEIAKQEGLPVTGSTAREGTLDLAAEIKRMDTKLRDLRDKTANARTPIRRLELTRQQRIVSDQIKDLMDRQKGQQ